MKRVQSWSEVVTYAECPHCKEETALGRGHEWKMKVLEAECDRCKKEFQATPPETTPAATQGTTALDYAKAIVTRARYLDESAREHEGNYLVPTWRLSDLMQSVMIFEEALKASDDRSKGG